MVAFADLLLLKQVEGDSSLWFWYLYQILGLYLLIPVVARGLAGLGPRDVVGPLSVAGACFFVWPVIASVVSIVGGASG